MKYVKAMVLSVVVAVGCCLGVAASASAEGGPLFAFLEGSVAYLLQSGQTLSALASAVGVQLLSGGNAVLECSVLKLASGAYLSGGSPGKDSEQLLYSGCSVNGHSSCDVLSSGQPLGSVETEPLESELVYLSEAAGVALNADESGTVFRPAPPAAHFVVLQVDELAGSGSCPSALTIAGGVPVKGSVVLENDEPLVHLVSHKLLAPANALPGYYLGVSGKKDAAKLELGGDSATYLGAVSVDVTLLDSSTNLAWYLCP